MMLYGLRFGGREYYSLLFVSNFRSLYVRYSSSCVLASLIIFSLLQVFCIFCTLVKVLWKIYSP